MVLILVCFCGKYFIKSSDKLVQILHFYKNFDIIKIYFQFSNDKGHLKLFFVSSAEDGFVFGFRYITCYFCFVWLYAYPENNKIRNGVFSSI